MPNWRKSPASLLGIAIWLVAALFFLYEFFLRTFVGSVAHQIIPDLHLNAETFAIIGSAYYASYGLMQVPVGILVDKFGVKSIMVFATLVCALATYLFANAHGFSNAFASRLLMGFGSSFAFVCLLAIAMNWFPHKYFAFFAGVSQFIGTMGPLLAAGPLIAIMGHYHKSWRSLLSIIASIGILLCIMTLLIVRNRPSKQNKQNKKFSTNKQPLRTRLLKLAKNTQAWAIALYSGAVYVSVSLLGAIWGTQYLQTRGLTQNSAADMVSLIWLGYAIGCPALGMLSDLSKRRKPTLIACGLIGLISTLSIVYLPVNHQYWLYALLFFALGIAASGQNVGFAAITEHVDLSTRATAIGMNNGAITLFTSTIPPIVSAFIMQSQNGRVQLQAHDFLVGFAAMPIVYIASIVIAIFLIKETYCRQQKEFVQLKVQS